MCHNIIVSQNLVCIHGLDTVVIRPVYTIGLGTGGGRHFSVGGARGLTVTVVCLCL